MGLDSITPYTKYMTEKGKGVFVLCRTSNPGAKDYEYEKLADGRHVYDLVGDKLSAMGKDYMGAHGYSSLGLVIGGTHIEEAKEIPLGRNHPRARVRPVLHAARLESGGSAAAFAPHQCASF